MYLCLLCMCYITLTIDIYDAHPGPRGKGPANENKNLDVEIGGFELKNFVQLLLRNDPNCIEMLLSRIIYIDSPLRVELKRLASTVYQWPSLCKHYINWANSHHKMVENESKSVINKGLKTFGYMFRAIMTTDWLIAHKSVPLADPILLTPELLLIYHILQITLITILFHIYI